MLSFSSKIYLIGVNPYVEIPREVLFDLFKQAGKEKGSIPVRGTIQNKPFIQTIVKYSGLWRLYINGIMRKAAGIDVGDMVSIEIAYDSRSRVEALNKKLAFGLSHNKLAKEAFEKLSPSRQKEINRYLNNMKTEASLERNVDKVIRHLVGDRTVGYFVLMDRSPKK